MSRASATALAAALSAVLVSGLARFTRAQTPLTAWPPPVSAFTTHAKARLRRELAPKSPPISNFGEIEPGIFRGAQPEGDAAYRFLKDEGVSTVVNLRRFHADDQALCRRYGLSCVRFPILLFPGDGAFFDWAELRRAFAFVIAARRAGRVVFIHCHAGADRTGVLAAALLIRANQSLAPDELWRLTWGGMKEHKFHAIYVTLKDRVRNWVFHPSRYPWICAS